MAGRNFKIGVQGQAVNYCVTLYKSLYLSDLESLIWK